MIVEMYERNQIYEYEESDLSHLICDVRDVDYEKTI